MMLRLLCATMLVAISTACGSSSNSTPAGPTTGTPVSIVNGSSNLTTTAYAPNPVTVAVGGTVTWVNNDNTAHTSTDDDANGGWSSGSIAPGAQFSRTFPTAGTFNYHCTIHPNMIGTVRVQ